ncbi:MAG: peptidoglycan DD-metalloendopeptidase family protein [Deltaproteobacteria bacterium]|nr:peptidoglycan DD-metalloendopeptidase family protein [Deltaproteobacteria bacterium]
MARRLFTIFVLNEKGSKFWRFAITRPLFLGSVFLGGLALGAFLYLNYSYLHDKTELIALKKIHADSLVALSEMKNVYNRVDLLEKGLGQVRQLESRLRTLARLEKIQETSPLSGVGGPAPYEDFDLEGSPKEVVDSLNGWMREMDTELARQKGSLEDLQEKFNDKVFLLSATPRRWPTRGWVTSGFGYRVSPFTGSPQMHEGVDISARMGAPVYAPAPGYVVSAGFHGSLGRSVTIDHGYGYVTRYGHLSSTSVKTGDRVERGQPIGTVGNTGRSTGPHLHYEVLLHSVPVNPATFALN